MKNGFTLIEVINYLVLLSLIILIISSFFIWVTKSNKKSMAMREVLDNSQRAMETMLYEIREAKSVYTPTTISDQLSLETTHYLSSDETSTYIDFFLCGDRLCLKKESENPIALTSDRVTVTSLSFTQVATDLNIPSVQVHLRIKYNTPAGKPEYQAFLELDSTASLRSY